MYIRRGKVARFAGRSQLLRPQVFAILAPGVARISLKPGSAQTFCNQKEEM